MGNSPSQEASTLREEIGFQQAILESLANAQDTYSEGARIRARLEIQLFVERLRKLEGMFFSLGTLGLAC